MCLLLDRKRLRVRYHLPLPGRFLGHQRRKTPHLFKENVSIMNCKSMLSFKRIIIRRKAPPRPERGFGKGDSGSHLFSLAEKASNRLRERREKPATIYRTQGAEGVLCGTHGDLWSDNSWNILAKCSRQAGTCTNGMSTRFFYFRNHILVYLF